MEIKIARYVSKYFFEHGVERTNKQIPEDELSGVA
jgi:hypothetical protein